MRSKLIMLFFVLCAFACKQRQSTLASKDFVPPWNPDLNPSTCEEAPVKDKFGTVLIAKRSSSGKPYNSFKTKMPSSYAIDPDQPASRLIAKVVLAAADADAPLCIRKSGKMIDGIPVVDAVDIGSASRLVPLLRPDEPPAPSRNLASISHITVSVDGNVWFRTPSTDIPPGVVSYNPRSTQEGELMVDILCLSLVQDIPVEVDQDSNGVVVYKGIRPVKPILMERATALKITPELLESLQKAAKAAEIFELKPFNYDEILRTGDMEFFRSTVSYDKLREQFNRNANKR